MKTTYIITLLFVIIFSQLSFSQSLLIKGFFKDTDGKSISVNYILLSDKKNVNSGIDKKIKIELELNKDYVLIVSKDGYVTKTVSFSTYTELNNDYSFIFDVILKEENKRCENLVVTGNVFFDAKLQDFNYVTNKIKYLQN